MSPVANTAPNNDGEIGVLGTTDTMDTTRTEMNRR
jgi:hypothetical protein